MDSLTILKAKINVHTTLTKFKASINELLEKHPERQDLIDSMNESVQHIMEFDTIFRELEENFYLECKSNLRLQMHISELNQKIHELKLELKICKEL